MPLVVRSSLAANTWVNSMGDGSAANPALTFSNNATVGIYKASDTIGFASQGADAMTLSATGTLTVGNIAAGPPSAPTTVGLGPWTQRNTASTNTWIAALWAEELGLFVATSFDGTGNRVQTSPDGIEWTSRASAADNQWWDLAWSPSLRLLVAVGVVTATSAGAIMTSPDAITWTSRTSPASPVLGWTGVAWSPSLGLFVAVGRLSLYSASSSDGTTWTAAATPEKAQAITWAAGLGKFVAVSSTISGSATNAVLTSSNGTTWANPYTGTGIGQRSVAWSDELQLLAAYSTCIYGFGQTNYLVTSPDAATWTSRRSFPSPGPVATNSVEYRGKVIAVPGLGFVALQTALGGYGYKNMVLVSGNGVTWSSSTYSASTIESSGISGASSVAYSPSLKRLVIFAGARTAYTADVYTPLAALEKPIVTHLARSGALALHSPTGNVFSVCNDKVHFDANGVSVFSPSQNSVSAWRVSILNPIFVNQYAWVDIFVSTYTGQAYAVNNAASGIRFMYSRQLVAGSIGDNWTSLTGGTISPRGVTSFLDTGECVIIVGVGGGMYANASGATINITNPLNMSPQMPSATWESVAASASVLVAVASTSTAGGKRVVTAPAIGNGSFSQTWTERTSAVNNWTHVIWAHELSSFVACANSGTNNRVMTSSADGSTWTSRTTPIDSDWRGVAWSPELSLLVVVGVGSWAMTSPTGTDWTARAVPTGTWRSVAWGASVGAFVAVSSDAGSMYSYDGVTWTRWGAIADGTWSCVAWSGHDNRFIALADAGAKRVMLMDTAVNRGNVSVSGVLTSGAPWGRGKFAAATAAAYIPLVSTQGTIGVTNSTQLFAPIPGRYTVGFQEIMNSSSVLNEVTIRVNGVDLVSTLSENTTTGFHYRNASTVVYLYSGDYLQFWINTGSVFTGSSAAGEWANYYIMLI